MFWLQLVALCQMGSIGAWLLDWSARIGCWGRIAQTVSLRELLASEVKLLPQLLAAPIAPTWDCLVFQAGQCTTFFLRPFSLLSLQNHRYRYLQTL